jgi:hypothetical protein
MSERWRDLSDGELGRALEAVGRHLAVPETPAVIPDVLARIHGAERNPSLIRPRWSLPSRRRAIVLIAAAVLLVAAVAFATELVIRLGAVTIEIVPSAPTSMPSATENDSAFGRPVSIAGAEARTGLSAAVPRDLAAPDHVWAGRSRVGFDPGLASPTIIMAWDPEPELPAIPELPWGAVLMQFDADIEIAVKTISADTGSVASVLVDGRSAWWITGAHALEITTPGGRVDLRVTGNVLVWQRGSETLRLETDLSVDRAVGIAESIE